MNILIYSGYVIPVGSEIQDIQCCHYLPSKRLTQTVFISLLAVLMTFVCAYTPCVQASVATAYYVLDPDFSLQEATVVSLEDGNTITAGNTQLYLDKGGFGTILAADLVQGTKVSGTGALPWEIP